MARILLVDDEASILSVLSTLLKAEGHDVVPILGGDKAQDVIRSDEFDLMISDIRMSPVDGMQLLKLIRREKPTSAVIMITAYGSVETAVEAMKEGAFDYVTKPFKVDELLSTVLRALDELADRIGDDGLPERRYARMLAGVRATAWAAIVAGHQGLLPAVQVARRPLARSGTGEPVTVIRVDATIIEAATCKEPSVTGHYKHGIGWHPLTAWCSNTDDHLAVMQRPGNAGSFTASDHVLVLDAALEQVPAPHRRDVLVTIDGAGASHDVIDHLTGLNTFKEHGRRGRRVEYTIGWPVDARTRTSIEEVPEQAWTARIDPNGDVAPDGGEVAEVTGLLRGSAGGDRLDGWPADMRVIVSRTPRPIGEQAKLGEDAQWRYSAFATNTGEGQLQWLDARHRTQAHVEDKVKELKAMGAAKLPTADKDRNAAWLQLAALAVTLTAWLRHLALDGELALAEPKTLRFRLFAVPARIARHARYQILKLPDDWAWADDLVNAWTRIWSLQPG